MLIPVEREIYIPLLLWSFAAGILFGAVYDIFRIRRAAFRIPELFGMKNEKKPVKRLFGGFFAFDTVLCFIEDIIFALFCAVVMTLINFKLHFGLPRVYGIGSAVLGFSVYYFTVGKLVIRSAEAIVRFMFNAFAFIYRHTVLPVTRLIKKLWADSVSRARRKRLVRFTEEYENDLIISVEGLGRKISEIKISDE